MKTEVQPVAENEILLAVEVSHDDVKDKVERTIRRLNDETSIPGFRKGRAPREVIVQRYGNDYILGQTLNDFLPEWYDVAVDEAELHPVSVPEIDVGDFSGDEALSFTAKVQVRPTPVLGPYTGLEVPKGAAAVTEAQVDAQLAMLQERLATLRPVEERAVQTGDFVQIDFAGSIGGEALEGAAANDYMLQVGFGNLIPGFEEQLVGMNAGDEKSFEITFPDDYHAEELAGKQATFTTTVKEIKEKIVPDLDDEFAKEASEFETLAGLRDDVRTRITGLQEAQVERDFRAAVVEAAVANATLAVPEAMVERQAHALYHELEETVGERGMEMTDYLAALEKTQEEVEAELRPRAEAVVRQGLVLSAIRDAEGVTVDDDEVRERIKADAEVLQRDPNQLVLDVYKSGRQNLIRDELVMAKTVDFLVERAVPTEQQARDDVTEEAPQAPPRAKASKPRATKPKVQAKAAKAKGSD